MVELKKIFRQASESDIVVNAHKINRGEQVVLDNKSRDFLLPETAECGRDHPGPDRIDPGKTSSLCGGEAI